MPSRPTIWFRAVSLVAALFVLTVFVMIAGLFSDPQLPINTWLNRNGTLLLLGEVGLLIALGTLAMLTDRSAIPKSEQGFEIQDEGASPSPTTES
jgi:hypothetical protein